MPTKLKTKDVNGSILITGGSVSQSETRQISQYNPNNYSTTYEFSLPEPIAIDDLSALSKLNRQVGVLQVLASVVNRKSESRDGLVPTTSEQADKVPLNLRPFPDSPVVDAGTESRFIVQELKDIDNSEVSVKKPRKPPVAENSLPEIEDSEEPQDEVK